jgi:hypothetical protein
MSGKIRCALCEYARQDRKASEYTNKRCGKCEKWADCEVCRSCKKRGDCKARKNQAAKQGCERRGDTVCGMQELRWAAFECTNPDSEYHRSLLNVTVNGDMQRAVTWSGCEEGVAR